MEYIKKHALFLFACVLTLTLCICVFLISSKITLYSDDFFYGTFFQQGFEHFFQMIQMHFESVNGRTLVHLIDSAVLFFDTKLFCILNPLLLLCFGYLSSKTLTIDRNVRIYEMFITLALILSLPISISNQTLYWITGSFNYLFPTIMAVLALYLQMRAFDKDKISWYAPVVCLLCGATTEQGGLAAFVMTLGYAIYHNVKHKKPKAKALLFYILPLCTLAGYLSILLAPGTLYRASFGGGALALLLSGKFIGQFVPLSSLMMGQGGIGPYIAILCFVVGILPFCEKQLSKALCTGWILSAAILICNIAGQLTPTVCTILTIGALLYFILVIILMFKHADYVSISFFLIAALFTQGIMLLVSDQFGRTLFPTFLLIAACISKVVLRLLFNYVNKIIPALLLCGMFALSLLLLWPTFEGYRDNSLMIEKNLQSIKSYDQRNSAQYCVDITYPYAHLMMFEDGYSLKYFHQYYGLPSDPEIYYYSSRFPQLYFDDTLVTHPSITEKSQLYLPLEPMLKAGGGSVSWAADQTHITFDNCQYIIDTKSRVLTGVKRGQDIYCQLNNYSCFKFGKLYVSQEMLSWLFELDFSSDETNHMTHVARRAS